jgi:hypothetical protein
MDMYVYYQVREEDAQALQVKVGEMHANLTDTHGVACSRKRQPQATDGRRTWMEVYLAVSDDFSAVLNDAARRAEILRLIDNERRIEYFVDGSSCA